jgi:hypothetical protein
MKQGTRIRGKVLELHLILLKTATELVDKEGGCNRELNVGCLTLTMVAARRTRTDLYSAIHLKKE